MKIIRTQEPNASRVVRTSECEMRFTLSGSLGAGHGRLAADRSLFLTRGKQAG
jgi:hypothetical protein